MALDQSYEKRSKKENLILRVFKGHFATSHSHINYYIDVSAQKMRYSEASALAKELASYYTHSTIIDTILCLDGMEVVGACLAHELTHGGFININAHQTVYVVTPERTTGSQLIFRDNILPMIAGKNVLILAASVTTGFTARAAIEAMQYYGGRVAGVCSIFASVDDCMGYPVYSVFDTKDLEGYASYTSNQCPLCKAGRKIDALVNGFGYSKL
ncbi:MAG: phosphoribosyltransferase [Clostridia bacterium]|nr:phosphoribosyltransferase [Clostridia bacterium]